MNWEEGEYKTKIISATAGNVQTNITPTASKKWKILYGIVTLVCNATVVNRYIRFQLQNSAGTALCGNWNGPAVVGSATDTFVIYPSGMISVAATAFNNSGFMTNDLTIVGTDRLGLFIGGGVAGDSYSGYIKYVELPA